MITPFSLPDRTPEPATLDSDALWLDVEDPSQAELDRLVADFGIPLSFLKDPLDVSERPRVEKENGCILIIARASRTTADGASRAPFKTIPVGVIITPTHLVTVCKVPGLIQGHLIHTLRSRTANPVGRMALALLMRICTTYINHLNFMDTLTNDLEHSLTESLRNEELFHLLHIEKTLIYFRTALKGNSLVLERLLQGEFLPLDTDLRQYLDDVNIECRQATDMAEIFSQILGSLSDAFGTVVSNNLNKVMKILTGLTIVFMIPPIISGFYGMNVRLPFAEHPYAFVGLASACVALCGGVWYFFWKKNWI